MSIVPQFFESKNTMSFAHIIHTADNFCFLVSHTVNIFTFILSLSNVLLIPKLSLNLIFVEQLYYLHLDIHFSHNGCYVQDL